jgi:hypothetical protein
MAEEVVFFDKYPGLTRNIFKDVIENVLGGETVNYDLNQRGYTRDLYRLDGESIRLTPEFIHGGINRIGLAMTTWGTDRGNEKLRGKILRGIDAYFIRQAKTLS